jgi:Ser/Thr protein kinase RdoA (MazF antagonist)
MPEIDREIVMAGAALYGTDVGDLNYIGGMDGRVYGYARDGRDYVLKLAPMDDGRLAALDEQLAFMRYLADGGVRVARPVPSRHGRLVEKLASGNTTLVAMAFERAPGKHVDAGNPTEWNATLYRNWGRTMGRMHALSRRYALRPDTALPDWRGEVDGFAEWCEDDAVRERWLALGRYLETLPRTQDCFGPVHNDLHPANFVVDGDGQITVIDFDVCNRHWFATDIGIAIYHALWMGSARDGRSPEEHAAEFLRCFMAGYAGENDLDAVWIERLPHFLKYRQILLYVVFSHEWAEGNDWQRAELARWRQRIVDGEPVVDPACLML